MDFLDGLVERITYYNAENGYTVLRLSARGHADLVTVVGSLPEITPGESLRLQGQWITNTQYGKQFKAERCEQVLPATIEGIKKYLGSGLIKGVGPVTAQRIVKKFGAETLDVLDRSPERIRDVLGIGPKRATLIARAWEEQKSIKQVMVFLQGHGVNTGLAVKIYKQYGDAAIDLVQADPYRLASDIYGIGFKTADKIAHDLGLPHDSPSRVAAGVVYTLSTLTDQGHVFSPQNKLIHDTAELLSVQPDQVTASLETLEQTDRIKREVIYPIVGAEESRAWIDVRRAAQHSSRYVHRPSNGNISHLRSTTLRDEAAVYLTPFYQGEVNVAKRLNGIIGSSQSRLADLRLIDFQAELNALGSTVSNRPRPVSAINSARRQGRHHAQGHRVDRRSRHRQDYDDARVDRTAGETSQTLCVGLAHGPRRQAPEPGHGSTRQDDPSVVGIRPRRRLQTQRAESAGSRHAHRGRSQHARSAADEQSLESRAAQRPSAARRRRGSAAQRGRGRRAA